MFPAIYVIAFLILLAGGSYSFTLLGHRALTTNSRARSALFAVPDENSANADKDSVAASEMKQVSKGLTHIKYNKYAPTAEEAKDMTDEQFRKIIFTRMVSLQFLLTCKCIQFRKRNTSCKKSINISLKCHHRRKPRVREEKQVLSAAPYRTITLILWVVNRSKFWKLLCIMTALFYVVSLFNFVTYFWHCNYS